MTSSFEVIVNFLSRSKVQVKCHQRQTPFTKLRRFMFGLVQLLREHTDAHADIKDRKQ